MSTEINVVKKVLARWNSNYLESDKVILYPVNCKPNSVSTISDGKTGQEIINEQILNNSNILIAIFKNIYGGETKVNGHTYESGTVTEISEFPNKDFRSVFFNGDK